MKNYKYLLIAILLVGCSKDDINEIDTKEINWFMSTPQNNEDFWVAIKKFNNSNLDFDINLYAVNNRIDGYEYLGDNNHRLFITQLEGDFQLIAFPVNEVLEVSKFGYKIIFNDKGIVNFDLISGDRNTYEIIYNIYSLNTSNRNSIVYLKINDNRNLKLQDDLDEAIDEAIKTFRLPFVNLFTDAEQIKEINDKLKSLPNDISNQVGEWKRNLGSMFEDIKKSISGLNEFIDRGADQKLYKLILYNTTDSCDKSESVNYFVNGKGVGRLNPGRSMTSYISKGNYFFQTSGEAPSGTNFTVKGNSCYYYGCNRPTCN